MVTIFLFEFMPPDRLFHFFFILFQAMHVLKVRNGSTQFQKTKKRNELQFSFSF
jgi:hypothetical protein